MFVLNFANNTGLVFYKIEYEIIILKLKIHVLKNKNCFVFRNIKLKRVQKLNRNLNSELKIMPNLVHAYFKDNSSF